MRGLGSGGGAGRSAAFARPPLGEFRICFGEQPLLFLGAVAADRTPHAGDEGVGGAAVLPFAHGGEGLPHAVGGAEVLKRRHVALAVSCGHTESVSNPLR